MENNSSSRIRDGTNHPDRAPQVPAIIRPEVAMIEAMKVGAKDTAPKLLTDKRKLHLKIFGFVQLKMFWERVFSKSDE